MSFRNQFQLLRERCLAESTREFLARGKSVARCDRCQLAQFACLCPWMPAGQTRAEFVLLLHRNEVFKPTNTGRLIADIFPGQTHAFCWSRTEPERALLQLLADQTRRCFIVFPSDTDDQAKHREIYTQLPQDSRVPTFILLDGTWKQSGRMFHLSRWLDQVPCIALPGGAMRGYQVRKSHQEEYLSTAEAAALCLQLADEQVQSQLLLDYFQLFNEHYLATRGSYPPVIGELHQRISRD